MFFTACLFNNDCDPSPDNIVDQYTVLNINPVVQDLFTDADNTSIASHTPDHRPNSNVWSQTASSAFYIQSNALQPNRQTDNDKAVIDSGLSNISLSCDVTPYWDGSNNSSYPGVVFRYTDANNYWYVYADGFTGVINMYQVVAGVSTQMWSYTVALISQTTYNFRIDCNGNIVTFYLNGTEITTVISSFNNTATIVGIRCGKHLSPATKQIWDNFKLVPFSGVTYNWPVFTEDVNNPLIQVGAGGSWEAADCNDPNVAFDPNNNNFALLYSGYSGSGNRQALGYATASVIDGPYTKNGGNPVHNNNTIENGGFVYFNNQWIYLYGDGSSVNILCATSPDLITWTEKGTVLSPNVSNYWEVTRVFDAFARVTQDGKTLQLWYAARNDADQINSINLATSTDGIHFTKSPLNPIYRLANIRGEPAVFVPAGKEGKEMLLCYDFGGVNSHYRQIDQILTIDGMNTWHRRSAVLQGSGAGWESNQVFDPFIYPLILSNVMYLFHSGANTSGGGLNLNSEIGVAVASFPFTSLLK